MKPKVAFYWCASCGGCEEAVIDLAEQLLDVTAAVDIVFWPVALDFKEEDVAALPMGGIAVSFINGAVRTSEQAEMARLLREKSQTVAAFGVCAQLGGIPGLANQHDAASILREVYGEMPPQEQCPANGHPMTLPKLFDKVLPLDRVIPVDYYVPGCPPMPGAIAGALRTLLGTERPPIGSVLAPDHALCDECPRRTTRPESLIAGGFRRPHQVELDARTCILAQGVPCLGPATRAGCGARCIAGNMPCTGCYGPTSRVRDFGGKALSALASVAAGNSEREIDEALAGIVDPVGTLYRYSLPGSLLERRRRE